MQIKVSQSLVKDIAELEDATCYTCGQELHADKKAEIAERKDKELVDANAYQVEVADKLSRVVNDLEADW